MDSEIQKYQTLLAFFVPIHLLIYAVTCFLLSVPLLIPLSLQGILALTAIIGYKLRSNRPELCSDFLSMAVALTPAVLVYMLSGHPWQIDAHMYFFAVLAMLTGLKSFRAVLFGATVIAVHHLSLNFILPYALFPNGTDFFRVVFHAIIVVVETAVILYIIWGVKRSDSQIKKESETAQKALSDVEAAREKQHKFEETAKQQRQQAMHEMARRFEKQVGSIVVTLEQAASGMQNMAGNLTTAVEETTRQSSSVASVSLQASEYVQTVASAAEELSISIREIAGNVSETANTAKACAGSAEISQEKLQHLQSAVDEIDSVIQSINDVAEQTNLLALNATIEAARAGDAGKGFAVVANEVKSLAGETHKMTEEISKKVGDIKSSAAETISSVTEIIEQITSVDQKTEDIATAIEEQNGSTEKISMNVQQAARGTAEVSGNIEQVQKAANDSSASTEQLSSAAKDLAQQASHLKESVDSFLREVRTV